MSNKITFFKNEEQKVKFKFNQTLAEIITGQIVMQRRTTLPCITLTPNGVGLFNKPSLKLIKDFKSLSFFKLKNGLVFVEFANEGVLKISSNVHANNKTVSKSFSSIKLKKYIFNELQNQKMYYHFYLHPTDKPNMYLLKELTNSWE